MLSTQKFIRNNCSEYVVKESTVKDFCTYKTVRMYYVQ